MRYQPNQRFWGVFAILLFVTCGCGGSDKNQNQANAATDLTVPLHGGGATVLLGSDFAGSWPSGLDPGTNVSAGSNLSLMNAIYGGLFQLTANPDGENTEVIGILAEGYELSTDGLSFAIHLRKGVVFSDGTPFNAEAVRFNIERAFKSPCSCMPRHWPWSDSDPVTALDEHTVVLRFSRPFGPIANAFPATALNWIASPSALRELGEDQFRITPVGAGPFRVVSNQLSAKLILERNPLYWQNDRPYLDRLTFQSIGSEQAAYQAILAGDADAYEGMQSTPLIEQALNDKRLTATQQLATSPLMVQLNTTVAPFDNPELRQAIYYATNVDAIRTGLFKDWYPVSQSFTAPGGLFYHDVVPGYRAYDIEKARAIVRRHDGLSVTLGTLRSFVPEQIVTALQSQWAEAGINVRIETHDLGTLINKFQTNSWQAMVQTAGAYDPDAGSGLALRFHSNAAFSGVTDPELDRLMAEAAGTIDHAERDRLYLQIAQHLSDNAYAPFLVAQAPVQLSRGLYGPGLTTKIPALLINTAVLWQDVWKAQHATPRSR